MKILLIGNYELGDARSMPRFGEMLRRELAARGHEVELLRAKAVLGGLGGGDTNSGGLSKYLSYVDMYVIFPLRVWLRSGRRWNAVHICDHSNAVYGRWVRGRKPSVTCHDLLGIQRGEGKFPQLRVGRMGRRQQQWIKRSLLAIQRVVCVSRATERDLRAMGFAGETRVIANPLNEDFHPASNDRVREVRQAIGLGGAEPYVLHVGGNLWYKNRPGLVRIFAALRKFGADFASLRFVMAGHPFNDELRAEVSRLGLGAQVIEMVDPPNDVVEALYTDASLLLFASLHEGFGWPIVEAQTLGCPVATSNREPMVEVAGGAAMLVDPEDAEGAAAVIATEWPRRAELRERGYGNAARFSREQLIGEYEDFLSEEWRRE
ncbi:glycosyltransferase family 4 protein [Edaphobacter bradus]|uniref:glycosyltransferase family 4 protein n=1 Tax=Edaphobacter bradus TaxID=2259016 RepID=UPI0021E0D83A|nr:glycosyltransferase family 1 protein [Edaphobacter bradus]